MLKENKKKRLLDNPEKVKNCYFIICGSIILVLCVLIGIFACLENMIVLEWVILGFPVLIIFNTIFVYGFNKKYYCENSMTDKDRLYSTNAMIFYWISFSVAYSGFIEADMLRLFVFGVLALLILFFNLWKVFYDTINTNSHYKAFLAIEFITGIVMTIYLIYRIPDINLHNSSLKTLQAIVTTIISAVYGGMITLAGVAWTIKNQEKNRTEEEIKKAKPLFELNKKSELERINMDHLCVFDYESENEEDLSYSMCGEFINSDNSNFKIKSCYLNLEEYKAKFNSFVFKNMTFSIKICSKNKIENCILVVEDVLENRYYYEISINNSSSLNQNYYSIVAIKQVSKNVLLKQMLEKGRSMMHNVLDKSE